MCFGRPLAYVKQQLLQLYIRGDCCRSQGGRNYSDGPVILHLLGSVRFWGFYGSIVSRAAEEWFDCAVLKYNEICNDAVDRSRRSCETVQDHLISSFCLPLLTYSISALDLSSCLLRDLGICWNDAFRSVFHINRWESVKLLQCSVVKWTFFVTMTFNVGNFYSLLIRKFHSSLNLLFALEI